jgi:RNA polymerase sigma factor (sigma-70 family)
MRTSDGDMARLMARAQRGDAAAYRALLIACQSWLARYYRGRIAPHMIDDLVQDTMISMHTKRATFDPDRAFLPWLAAIARFRWIDQLRRGYRADETELPETLSVGPHDDEVGARIGIGRLLALLPAGQAEVLRLVKIEGLSVAEASAATGQSESLVKVNVHRGLKRLATLCESE